MVFNREIIRLLEKKAFDKEIHQLLTGAVSATICFFRNAWKSNDDILRCAIAAVGYSNICEGTRDDLECELKTVLEQKLVGRAVSVIEQLRSVEHERMNDLRFEFAFETLSGRVILVIRSTHDPKILRFYDVERDELVHDTESTVDAWIDEIMKE